MRSIQPCDLPPTALLRKYQQEGGWADCYFTEVARRISLAEYVEDFYTTPLFKVERRLLAWFVSKPATDDEARQLAAGERDLFAAWRVEARSVDQLLLADYRGQTRSWLMVSATSSGNVDCTRLYFGSAIVPVVDARSGTPSLGLVFRALLGFHNLYSRALLKAARTRLLRRSR